MRIKLELEPLERFPYGVVGKHAVQGVIYSRLTGTKFAWMHDNKTFKFFTFSDIFPSGDFEPGKIKTLLISSPNEELIETLYEKLQGEETLFLGKHPLKLVSIKKFSLRPKRRFITGSPIVVRSMKGDGFFTFYHEKSLSYFIKRLTENAVKKYEAFTGEKTPIEGPLFVRMVPKIRKNGWVDVYVRVNIRGEYFDVPGSKWELLEAEINNENERFYSFIMDAGVGELNSLGFGFINPVK